VTVKAGVLMKFIWKRKLQKQLKFIATTIKNVLALKFFHYSFFSEYTAQPNLKNKFLFKIITVKKPVIGLQKTDNNVLYIFFGHRLIYLYKIHQRSSTFELLSYLKPFFFFFVIIVRTVIFSCGNLAVKVSLTAKSSLS
jgi:hypothetical protein